MNSGQYRTNNFFNYLKTKALSKNSFFEILKIKNLSKNSIVGIAVQY
jgi:hypothetical protein